MPAFDPEFRSSLERLAALAKRLGRGRPARRRVPRRAAGASGEFRDRRPYSPGDDLRHIDWAGYRRWGRLLVKLFEAEEPREVWVLLDASASMRPARKLAWARRAAAAVAFLAAGRHDRVGLAFFADAMRVRRAPAAGRGVAARLLAEIEAFVPEGRSDPARAFRELVERRRRRRGLAAIVTDALWPGEVAAPLAVLEAAGLEAVLVHAIEPEDRAPPLEGEIELLDRETGFRRAIAADAALVEKLAHAFDAHAAAVEGACARTGAAYIAARTDEPVEAALLELLRSGLAGG